MIKPSAAMDQPIACKTTSTSGLRSFFHVPMDQWKNHMESPFFPTLQFHVPSHEINLTYYIDLHSRWTTPGWEHQTCWSCSCFMKPLDGHGQKGPRPCRCLYARPPRSPSRAESPPGHGRVQHPGPPEKLQLPSGND